MTIHTINRWRGVALVCLAVCAGVALSGYLGYRGAQAKDARHAGAKTDMRLCQVLRTIITASDPSKMKPGSPGYSYYHDSHLDPAERKVRQGELQVAQRTYGHTLGLLNCRHLPTVHS